MDKEYAAALHSRLKSLGVDVKKVEKAINKAHRHAAYAYNAHTRAMQHGASTTGMRNHELSNTHWAKFEATLIEVKKFLGIEHKTDTTES